MDIARPEFKKQKRRHQVILGIMGLLCLGVVTIGVSRLKSAAPEVERSTVCTDTVKRGPMVRQFRGLGSLIPSEEFTRQIPAESEATVVRILKLSGSQVKSDTVLLEMSNPQVEQQAVDARLQLKAAKAEYQSLRVRLQLFVKQAEREVHLFDSKVVAEEGLQKLMAEVHA
jgi:multidrug efflux pump subunit AcrA (membrane-fusion protein)